MNLERYQCTANESFLDFEFYSEGPNGKIKKIVRYSPQNANGIKYFNLGFGDWNEELQQVDDKPNTNNGDREKILATVASTVLVFTEKFPDAMIYVKGSSPSRTRLYQMGIVSNWNEIETLLYVYGFVNGNWYPFERNIRFEAFLALHK